MNLTEITKFLLSNDYATVLKSGKLTLTGNFQRALEEESLITYKGKLKEKGLELNYKQLTIQLLKDSKVPYKIDKPSGSYIVGISTKSAVKKVTEILSSGVEYDLLKDKIKAYYKSSTSPVTFTKMLVEDMWENIDVTKVDKVEDFGRRLL